MCRILGYLGPQIPLDQLVVKPEHSMLVQSYKPKEMKSAVLNGDGFGLGWHAASQNGDPFIYRNVLPMWNDRNLDDLGRYIQASSFVVNLRSATDKMPIDISNCQPWKYRQMLFVHNGLIENFFESMQRPIREKLCDLAYRSIRGLTDSEHIFALLVHHIETQPGIDLAEALHQTIKMLASIANAAGVRIAVNVILSTPERLIALRYDNQQPAPSLYLLKNSDRFPNSVILSSEGLFEDNWLPYSQSDLITIDKDLTIKHYATVD